MNMSRLLLSGALKPTRVVRRSEGLVLSGLAIGGSLALVYHVLAPAFVAAGKVIVAWAIP